MKRSKIILGVTTCLLGVAAFAASKAKWSGVPTAYLTSHGGCFVDPSNQVATNVLNGSQLKTIIAGATYPLYTNFNNNQGCTNPAYHVANPL